MINLNYLLITFLIVHVVLILLLIKNERNNEAMFTILFIGIILLITSSCAKVKVIDDCDNRKSKMDIESCKHFREYQKIIRRKDQ